MSNKIRGLGGIFIYSNDPKKLGEWYTKHFGIDTSAGEPYGVIYCEYRYEDKDDPNGYASISWSILKTDKEIDRTNPSFCVNYRVDNLDDFAAYLLDNGIEVNEIQEHPEGKFTRIKDPEGNQIELWEPTKEFFEG